MNFSDFLLILRRFLDESGMTQRELALASGVQESQLSEWLSGKRGKLMSKGTNRVLAVIQKKHREGEIPIPREIDTAIRRVWDGDPQKAIILANLIESLGPAFEYTRKVSTS